MAIGAWMPANVASGVASPSGDWRVAPLPQWAQGEEASAENGGSPPAIPEGAQNAFWQNVAQGALLVVAVVIQQRRSGERAVGLPH